MIIAYNQIRANEDKSDQFEYLNALFSASKVT